MKRRFQQVDVFGARPLFGNPLAVVLDGEGLSADEMQHFARWTNLSETVFLLPPTTLEADYRVRIFTLARELPFAGHPTLGSCHAWLTSGGRPERADVVVQECGAGLVPIRRTGDRLAFAAPPLIRSGPVDPVRLQRIVEILHLDTNAILDAQWADNGPGWIAVLLRDAEAVLNVDADLSPDPGKESVDIGLVGPYPEDSDLAFEVRAFFTDERGLLREDPVTGSLNASLAQWLLTSGRARSPYVASQGSRLERDGRIEIDRDGEGTIWVGGATTTCVEGEVELRTNPR